MCDRVDSKISSEIDSKSCLSRQVLSDKGHIGIIGKRRFYKTTLAKEIAKQGLHRSGFSTSAVRVVTSCPYEWPSGFSLIELEDVRSVFAEQKLRTDTCVNKVLIIFDQLYRRDFERLSQYHSSHEHFMRNAKACGISTIFTHQTPTLLPLGIRNHLDLVIATALTPRDNKCFYNNFINKKLWSKEKFLECQTEFMQRFLSVLCVDRTTNPQGIFGHSIADLVPKQQRF